MKQVDHGIFLHRTSYSESSVIATFYTKNAGMQKLVFQGAKKKSAVLFPLNVCELVLYKRPDSELGKLTQVTSEVPVPNLLLHPIKSIVSFFIADVIRQSLFESHKEPELFNFLKQSIVALEETQENGAFPLIFLVKFTSWIGIQPHTVDEGFCYFNLKEGEFHADYREGEWCIDGELCQALNLLFEKETIIAEWKHAMFDILIKYYQLHIPRFDVERSLSILRETLL